MLRLKCHQLVIALIFIVSNVCGCGGSGNDATTTSPLPSDPPGAPANDTTVAKSPVKPVKTPKPKSKAAPDPVSTPADASMPAYVMLPKQAYTLEPAVGVNQFELGPAEVNAQEHVLFLASAPASVRPAIGSSVAKTPDGLSPAPNATHHDTGFATIAIAESDGSAMVFIPEGQYVQGSRAGAPTEQPEHAAFVSSFYIDQYEVTVDQFQVFRDAAREDGNRVGTPLNADGPGNHPVVGVSFRDAQAYATWAGKELPSETQWEYAARGVLSLQNVWGTGRPLWSRPRSPGQIEAVGSFPSDRSISGVFDLAGNAREWCRDSWSAESYEEAAKEAGGVARNWTGPKRAKKTSDRVVRGQANGWSITAREGLSSSTRDPLIGFRCVVPIERIDAD